MTRSVFLACVASTVVFAQETTPDKRLKHAAESLQDLMKAPDKGIPEELLEKAKCIIVVPGLIKGFFGIGGKLAAGLLRAAGPAMDGAHLRPS